MWRRDCDWTAELYGVYANGARQNIYTKPCRNRTDKIWRASKFKRRTIPFSPGNPYFGGHYPTQIIQRVRCLAGRCKTSALKSPSGRRVTRVDARTFEATAAVQDVQAPAVAIVGGEGLASGRWLRGEQSVRFDASDASGIRYEALEIAGQARAPHERDCYWAQLLKAPPCPNGPGQLSVATGTLLDGHHTAQVAVTDAAGNVGRAPLDVFLDNTPPAWVSIGVEGGDSWRSQNGFAVTWQNPPEAHAPIDGALYQTRKVGDAAWSAPTVVEGDGISRIGGLNVPVGETEVRVWRRDQAGNQTEQNASNAVVLRYDPEAPQLGFEASPPEDPTKVTVAVTERVSGVAGGQIELSAEGSGVWQTLPTQARGRSPGGPHPRRPAPSRPVLPESAGQRPRRQRRRDQRHAGDHAAAADPVCARCGHRTDQDRSRDGQAARQAPDHPPPSNCAERDRACALRPSRRDCRAAHQPRRAAAPRPGDPGARGRARRGRAAGGCLSDGRRGPLRDTARSARTVVRCGSSTPVRRSCCPPSGRFG
jgi:hypothetical protein